MRADAVRNRANILRAARSVIATQGEDAAMDDIAAEAGVAVGTLYRHFPTKADLVNAILDGMVERFLAMLDEAAARAAAGERAIDVLTALLERATTALGEDRAMKPALAGLGLELREEVAQGIDQALGNLIAAGQRDGSIRPDVTPDDLILVVGALPGEEVPEPARRRLLQIFVRGLTTCEGPDDLRSGE